METKILIVEDEEKKLRLLDIMLPCMSGIELISTPAPVKP